MYVSLSVYYGHAKKAGSDQMSMKQTFENNSNSKLEPIGTDDKLRKQLFFPSLRYTDNFFKSKNRKARRF